MTKARCLFSALALLLGLMAVCPWAQAEPGPAATVMVLGRHPAGDNEAAAREAAVAQALRQAVAMTALAMVDPATLRSQLAGLDGRVLAKASQFVTTYSLQAHARSGDEVVVLVSASVDKRSLDQALTQAGLRLPAARQALTLALVSEEAAPGRPEVFWWGGAPGAPTAPAPVAEVLKSLGVRMVEPGVLAGKVPAEARQPVLNEEQALELARAAQAGLVIMGRVRTYPLVTPQGESPPPVAQLMALDVASQKALAFVETEGPSFHLTPGPGAGPAVTDAVQQSVRQLLEQVSQAAPSQGETVSEVTLTIRGLRSLADLHRFEQVLGSLSGLVASARRESVGAGWAELKVRLNGPPSQLADQLIVQDFGDFLVNVLDISQESVKLLLIGK
ncbi:hypothetical protein AAU61_16125 [Desulfocarbo indianensis]|nr:hypothetical protein AAU61_16125 [Desulfocarbo indianensis]